MRSKHMVGRTTLHPKDVHVLSSGCVSTLLQMEKRDCVIAVIEIRAQEEGLPPEDVGGPQVITGELLKDTGKQESQSDTRPRKQDSEAGGEVKGPLCRFCRRSKVAQAKECW